jgi:WXG100 family type VII secretion target
VGGYRVDTAALARADALLGETVATARSALNDMRAEAAALFGARWDGPAARAFHAGWAEWLDGMHALLDALEATARALGRSGAGYAGTHATVRTTLVRAAS